MTFEFKDEIRVKEIKLKAARMYIKQLETELEKCRLEKEALSLEMIEERQRITELWEKVTKRLVQLESRDQTAMKSSISGGSHEEVEIEKVPRCEEGRIREKEVTKKKRKPNRGRVWDGPIVDGNFKCPKCGRVIGVNKGGAFRHYDCCSK